MTEGNNKFALRRHPRLRGRWPVLQDARSSDAQGPDADEDVLQWVEFYPPNKITLGTYHAGSAYYRTLFLSNRGVAKRLADFLKTQVGRTLAEVGDAEVEL